MGKYKEIAAWEAIEKAANPEEMIFMVTRVYPGTTVEELTCAAGFFELEAEVEKPKSVDPPPPRKKIDHGKILALYTANPPHSVTWIAQDIGCSVQTVINHLKQEGIYRGKSDDEK
ncbi:MAG: hypothetical protein IJ899_00630 [Blautia sp.]|nr:hypothetical protein [Blautia sp.]MBR2562292.1 hypothetical protein [Eubacterium sp.]